MKDDFQYKDAKASSLINEFSNLRATEKTIATQKSSGPPHPQNKQPYSNTALR